MDITNKVGPINRRKNRLSLIIQCFNLIIIILLFSLPCSGLKGGFSNEDYCINDTDCAEPPWTSPYPSCQQNSCTCPNGTCKHFTHSPTGIRLTFCGECGEMGSECQQSTCECPSMSYVTNTYCTCQTGRLVDDICVHYQSITTSRITIILIAVFVGILIINRLVLSHKTLRKLFRRIMKCRYCPCRRESESDDETEYGYNRQSEEKSAAYTISSREFIASSADPDLAWALELSTQLANETSSRNAEILNTASPPSYRIDSNRRRHRREISDYSQESTCSASSSAYLINSRRWTRHSSLSASGSSSSNSTPSGSLNRRGGYTPRRLREEIILTEIINKRRSSSTSTQDMAQTSTEGGFIRGNSLPANVRRKTRKYYEPLGETSSVDLNSVTSTPPLSRGPSSGAPSSTYSSARSNFSRDFRSFTELKPNLVDENHLPTSDSLQVDIVRNNITIPLMIRHQNSAILEVNQDVHNDSNNGNDTAL